MHLPALKARGKRIVEIVVNQRAFGPFIGPLLQIASYASRIQNCNTTEPVSYDQSHRVEGVSLIRQIYAERGMLLSLPEAYTIFSTVKHTAKIPGDIAEVGVYQGGSAKLICEAKGARHLHLFDTFEGLPAPKEIDRGDFTKGQFTCSIESVGEYLGSYKGVTFHKGFFPDTTSPVSNHKFSFVNIDVDIYESTRSSLEFFFPRMSAGGVMISHDYSAGGVKAAFDEFLRDKREGLIELVGDQCLVVKVT